MSCGSEPGVGLENKGHQGSQLFNPKGVFLRHVQLQLQRGIKRTFIVIKELKGLLLLVGTWFKSFPTHSLILTSSMLLKGSLSTIKSRKVCNVGAGGGVCCIRQNAFKGIQRIADD